MGSITGIKTKSLSKSELEKNIDVMLNCFRLKNEGEVIFDTNGYVGMGFINERIEDDSNSIYYRVGFSEVMITLDGKIDNREEIFSLLKISSSAKITDNLLIALLYDKFKKDFPRYLKGQFAIGLYDIVSEEVFLTKDPIGLKQLFYYIDSEEVRWFTEILQLKAITTLDVNMNYLENYLKSQPAAYVETAYRKLYRVEAGEIVKISKKIHVERARYYNFPVAPVVYSSEIDYIEHFQELFKNAIKKSIPKKIQDIGFSLSGGLDSSSIFSYAHYYKYIHPSKMNVFSYTFSNNLDADESEYIDEVLNNYSVEKIYKFDCNDEWCFKGGLDSFKDFDEPYPLYGYSLSSIIPKAVEDKGIKVLISGHCGDHVLMGNLNYLYNLLTTFKLSSYSKGLMKWRESYSLKSLLFTYSRKPKDVYLKSPDWLRSSPSEGEMVQDGVCWDDESRRKYFEGIVYQSGHEWVTQYVSKRYGIETRYPFMDIDLMEFLLNIPVDLKINPKYDKYILKEASKGILPKKIQYRKQKAGHSNLITKGLRKEWGGFQEHLNLEALNGAGLVNSDAFMKTIKNFYMGNIQYYSDIVPITRTLSAEIWLKNQS